MSCAGGSSFASFWSPSINCRKAFSALVSFFPVANSPERITSQSDSPVRFARASTDATIWIAVEPPPKAVYPVQRYLQAIGDAAINGGRWVVALDDDLSVRESLDLLIEPTTSATPSRSHFFAWN